VSLPFADSRNARQMAASATASGRIHDVVVGASKLQHNAALDERDRVALQWALELLNTAATTDVVFAMPPSQQLATTGATISALRRAARSSDADVDTALARIRDGLASALSGRRGKATLEAMGHVQALFSVVSRIALQTEVHSYGEREGEQAWPMSTTTSPS